MNNILLSPLAKGVIVDGAYYQVNSGFKTWLEFGRILKSDENNKAEKILILCYKNKIPDRFDKAFGALCDFYTMGEKSTESNGDIKAVFDFEKDSALIYAAFLHEYGIDLAEENIHWWKFLSLLQSVSKDSRFMEIVGYRCVNPADIKDKNRRNFYRKMKRLFSIDENRDTDIASTIESLF